MATVRLVLTKPLNVSLQAKASDVSSTTANIDNGAWDIVYFTRMEGGKQIGDVQRLGKCINIETAEGDYYSEELITDGGFSTPSNWDAGTGWSVSGGNATFTPSAFGASLKQLGLTFVEGNTYEITFDITSWTAGYLTVLNHLPNAASLTLTTGASSGDTITNTWTQGSTNTNLLDLGCTAIFDGTIDNISVKDIVTLSSNQYLVDVEVDSTAQTPIDGDYIFFGKENKVCISGIRGYYAEVEMKNDSTEKAELFSVGSEMIPSSK